MIKRIEAGFAVGPAEIQPGGPGARRVAGLRATPSRAARFAGVLFAACLGSTTLAHGFGQRYDLPVPLWLYVTGAAAAVVLSFVMVGVFVRVDSTGRDYPSLNLLRWPLGRGLASPIVTVTLKVLSVAMFLLVVLVGLFGSRSYSDNLAPVMVWVIWWVGLAYVSALVGNLWALINPWKVTWEWLERFYQRFNPGESLSYEQPYPNWLGVWPAVLLFMAFAWVELVYTSAGVPSVLASLILIYSVITWAGMAIFGKDTWVAHGEAFSLVFGLLARFAPTELRVSGPSASAECGGDCSAEGRVNCYRCFAEAPRERRELNFRPFAVGLLRFEATTLSMMVFVLALLASVTFDGFTSTPAWLSIQLALYELMPSVTAIGTVGLVGFVTLFLTLYLLFCILMGKVSKSSLSIQDLAKVFTFSLVPIALAYHLAHYLTFLLTQGQLLIPLLSDPFGFGWNLFGTADYQVDLNLVGARFAWYAAVIAIVAGHVIAVYLAHVVALKSMRNQRVAQRSQYPMLALMVGYTVISLWILAQPIVEGSPG